VGAGDHVGNANCQSRPRRREDQSYGQLGWWQFDKIRAAVGPAAEQPIRTYRRAFIVFIVIVILGAAAVPLVAQALT
jgi:hypothetical protein